MNKVIKDQLNKVKIAKLPEYDTDATTIVIKKSTVGTSESVNALDSLVMISNEFTGNGYGIFGATILGKFNSLLLVWGGYVISGVSAATLTAAILRRHFNKRFAELEKLIEGDDE